MLSLKITTIAAVVAGMSIAAPAALAEDYPSRTIEVIHSYGPGGGTDRFVRAVAVPFEEISGQSMVPISIQGGGGMPAFANFQQRRVDGYTLMAISPDQIIAHALGRISMDAFQPLARVQYDQGMIVVPADSPFQTIEEFIAHARENPGDLTVGITGAAGFDDTVMGLWNIETGAEVTTVPFGSSEMVSNTLGGQVDAMHEEYGPARGLIDSGDMRPLVVFSDERLPVLPDVPTAVELGYDVTLGRWRAFAMPADADPAHVETLYGLISEAVASDAYQEVQEQAALQFRSELLDPEEFQAFIEEEIEVYTRVLDALGLLN
ncbi:MAG: tripartite tricarboxylate transporter substrate binding protein [Roseicyclus sp.]|uniref:Bug family tripartite tricarboxylate transporter substrate binding protein n=1 Tax=Boseongicola sp. H5 TaxID=2763261 RepID=UPI001B2285B5|nr:tripartite tricarboxylate transporter substrate binding protein [Boseongicola sp. H5]MBO6602332.1 tripartite tricarboxylate transporter substrate binding protein [Roseicyclus sp.]MBO6623751.1 tripartite tricarboxylate transporter substrate binding protein [Roseicyclus sp.]MBO6922291.1 tripartite tricarboxylate transporter substrate binding protein [Roseicyclus sp.]